MATLTLVAHEKKILTIVLWNPLLPLRIAIESTSKNSPGPAIKHTKVRQMKTKTE